jgi:hypothetical protein
MQAAQTQRYKKTINKTKAITKALNIALSIPFQKIWTNLNLMGLSSLTKRWQVNQTKKKQKIKEMQ